nr:MAG TPA: hypothetical protein [Caudoviricetes sp.]
MRSVTRRAIMDDELIIIVAFVLSGIFVPLFLISVF